MEYKQIEEANKLIKPIKVKGKDYAQVHERVKAFRSVWTSGTIETEIVDINGESVTMQATVRDEDGVTLATGYANEVFGSTLINKTSAIENCETSAVGRALGFCGFGIETSIASASEVRNAINQQEAMEGRSARAKMEKEEATEAQKRTILELCKTHRINLEAVYEANGLSDPLNKMEATMLIKSLAAKYEDD